VQNHEVEITLGYFRDPACYCDINQRPGRRPELAEVSHLGHGFAGRGVIGSDLLAGHIDALLTLLGAPVPAIQDLDAKEPVTFLSLSAEQMEAIRKEWPEFGPAKIAAGTYRLLDKDYITVGVPNFAIGRADLPDDLVYQLVKAVYENQPRLVKATSAASDTLPQNVVKNTFLPFHPGAVRYYREIGINISDALAPTN
jgi:TRAP transporter TAXI family solute receptor